MTRVALLLLLTLGGTALADDHPDEARRLCEKSREEVEKFFPEGHLARLQTRACLALAHWGIERSESARQELMALKPSLDAAGRVGAFWQGKVDTAMGVTAP